MKIRHTFSSYAELNKDELYDMLALRVEVFVVEQDCPYQDLDRLDQQAVHLLSKDENGKILATLRILPPGVAYDCHAIGRVVVSPSSRGTGLGHVIMEEALKYLRGQSDTDLKIKLSAQEHLRGYYERHGFKQCGEGYLEDGIPHIPMDRLMEGGV